jgi:hypothetical protein
MQEGIHLHSNHVIVRDVVIYYVSFFLAVKLKVCKYLYNLIAYFIPINIDIVYDYNNKLKLYE